MISNYNNNNLSTMILDQYKNIVEYDANNFLDYCNTHLVYNSIAKAMNEGRNEAVINEIIWSLKVENPTSDINPLIEYIKTFKWI